MDPLSALSVAASAVQFVDFGCRLFSSAKEVYKSADGNLIGYKQSEDAALRLNKLTEGLKASLQSNKVGQLAPGEQALKTICSGCIEVANELHSIFLELRIKSGAKHRKWESFKKAFLSVWSRKEVERISMRLQQYSEELRTHVLVSIAQKFEKLSLSNEEELSQRDQDLQYGFRDLIDILDSVRRDIKDSIDRNAFMAEQELEDATDQSLLESLRFESMNLRFEQICEAHRNTFRWLYQNDRNGQSQQWSSLGDWLSGDGRIYWVNGKAGSGKSTLMRYICGHAETSRLLSKWSPDVIVAKYFFWNSGTKEQKSQEGLLRCLLFEALNQRRDLIRTVFPEQWVHYRSLGARSYKHNLWSLCALKIAFERLAKSSTECFKMCFFVDGLDEFEGTEEAGDHRMMADFLLSAASSSVKICLSSRPWRTFAETFRHYPKLRLQDLTENDMRLFATDELVQNGRMKAFHDVGSRASIEFVDQIVLRAEGVFLWVTLVLKSIVSGICRHETVSDLKGRLRRLPSDLEGLYDHMFTRIDPHDMQKAAQIIQIFEASGYHASVIRIGCTLEATYEKACCTTWDEWSRQDLESLQKRTAAMIETTCQGFIEIHEGCRGIDRNTAESDSWGNEEQLPRLIQELTSFRLFYIHRSVREYIQKEEIKRKLLMHTSTIKDFDPLLSNVMASVLLCKVLPPVWHRNTVLKLGRPGGHSRECGWHHSVLDKSDWNRTTRLRHSDLLNQLYFLQYNITRYSKASLSDTDFVNKMPDREAQKFEADFFVGAITCGYTFWAMQRLKKIERFPESNRPLLSCVFGERVPHKHPLHFHLSYGPKYLEFLLFMLQHGANANEAWSADEPHRSIWAVVLVDLDNDLSHGSSLLSNEELELRVQYVCAFLEHGADTEAELEVPYGNDATGEDRYVVSVESVITRFEELEVEGSDKARYLFEEHRSRGWKTTEPTCYRKAESVSGAKRTREESYLGNYDRGAMRKRVNEHHFNTHSSEADCLAPSQA